MDWELLQFGLGDTIDIELAIVVLVVGLAVACIGPLLAMGSCGKSDDGGGHPLRSKLYTAAPVRAAPRPLTPENMKFKTRTKSR